MRPSGTCLTNAALTAGTISGGSAALSKTGVSVGPGAIAFTRMPSGASSSAHDCVSDSIAALVAP